MTLLDGARLSKQAQQHVPGEDAGQTFLKEGLTCSPA